MTEIGAILAFVLICGAYVQTWQSFPAIWSDYFGHGFPVLAFTLWLGWTERKRLAEFGRPSYGALIPLAGLSLLWMLAVASRVQVIHQTLAPLVLATWGITVIGVQAMPTVGRLLAFFMLAVPFWMLLIPVFQAITVFANSVLLKVLGMQAVVRGNLITIPNGTFEVAGSCAGEAFFMSGLTIAAIYTQLFNVSKRASVWILFAGAGLSMVSNWLRVFGLILVGHLKGMTHPLVIDHGWYGWVIFVVFQGVFFWLAPRIERRWPVSSADNANSVQHSYVASEQSHTLRAVLPATGIGILGPGLLLLLSALPLAQVADATPGIVLAGKFTETALWTPAMNGASDRRTTTRLVDGIAVQADRFIYSTQSQGRELVNEMNFFAADSVILDDKVIGFMDGTLRFVRQTVIRNNTTPLVAWSWYHVAGFNTASATRAKLLEMMAFVARSAPSEMVIVSAPCNNGNCQEAINALSLTVTGQRLPSAPPSR